MPINQRCMYSLCQNNTYPVKHRSKYVNLIPFPRPRKDPVKCQKWISACKRFDNQLDLEKVGKKTYYICQEHFVGGNGPTNEYPNPIPFEETSETLNLMSQSCSNDNSKTDEYDDQSVLNLTMIVDRSNDGLRIESHFENPEFPDNKDSLNSSMIIGSADTAYSKQVKRQIFYGNCIPGNWLLDATDVGIIVTTQNIQKGLITKSYSLNDHELRGTLKIHGKSILESHPLVKSLPDITSGSVVTELLKSVNSFPLCIGITQDELIKHFETKEKTLGYKSLYDDALHSLSCDVVLRKRNKPKKNNLQTKDLCEFCKKYRRVLMKSLMRQRRATSSKCGEKRVKYLTRKDLVTKFKAKTQRWLDYRKKIKKIKRKLEESRDCGHFLHDKDSKFIEEQFN